MIFKQETIKSWFSGVGNSINNEVVQPFQNAGQVIWKYNQAIQHNSLTQQGWEAIIFENINLQIQRLSEQQTKTELEEYKAEQERLEKENENNDKDDVKEVSE